MKIMIKVGDEVVLNGWLIGKVLKHNLLKGYLIKFPDDYGKMEKIWFHKNDKKLTEPLRLYSNENQLKE